MRQSCFNDEFLKTCTSCTFIYDISNGAGTDCAEQTADGARVPKRVELHHSYSYVYIGWCTKLSALM
jgi:hypothetical protein